MGGSDAYACLEVRGLRPRRDSSVDAERLRESREFERARRGVWFQSPSATARSVEALAATGGRKAAIQVKNISSFMVGEDEFAVEAYL